MCRYLTTNFYGQEEPTGTKTQKTQTYTTVGQVHSRKLSTSPLVPALGCYCSNSCFKMNEREEDEKEIKKKLRKK